MSKLSSNSSNRVSTKAGWSLYTAIFLLSGALLIQEIALTRIFAIAMYSSYVNVALSLAMIGLAAGAIFVYLLNKKGLIKDFYGFIILMAALSVFAMLIAMFFTYVFPFRPYLSLKRIIAWFIVFGALAIPFSFLGIVTAAMVTRYKNDIQRIYTADLIGAATGSLGTVLLFQFLTGPQVLAFGGLLASVSALLILFTYRNVVRRFAIITVVVLSALIISLFFVSFEGYWSRPSVIAKYKLPRDTVADYWSGLSTTSAAPKVVKLGNSPHDEIELDTYRLYYDAVGQGFIFPYPLDEDLSNRLSDFPGSLPYKVTPPDNVLIIGFGGGKDIIIALENGVKEVDAVDVNPGAEKLLVDDFAEFCPLATDSRVELFVNDGRIFVAGSNKEYDIITIPMSWQYERSLGASLSLSSTPLFTTEALGTYLDHLKQDGYLSIIHYYFENDPTHKYRLTATLAQTLRERGVSKPDDNIIVYKCIDPSASAYSGRTGFVLKNEPFGREEIESFKAVADELNIEIEYMPDVSIDPIYKKVINKDYECVEPYNLKPITDDKPYLDFMVGPKEVILAPYYILFPDDGSRLAKNIRGIFIFYVMFVIIIIVALALILIPILFAGHPGKRNLSKLPYFGFLGIGFMFAEIALINHLTLYLGYPIYSISAVLFSLLIFCGIGASLSRNFRNSQYFLPSILMIIAIIVVLFSIIWPIIFSYTISFPLLPKLLISFCVIAPLGLAMGAPLPSALYLTDDERFVPWAWGINGIFSILAINAAFFVVAFIGYKSIFYVSSVSYLLAIPMSLLFILNSPRK